MKSVALAGAALGLLLALAGCSQEEDPPEGGATPSPGSTSEPTESPTETPTETPSETPAVDAATGPELNVGGIAVRVPDGWRASYDTAVADTATGKQGVILLGAIAGDPMPLGAQFKRDVRGTSLIRDVERLADVELGGEPAFQFRARTGSYVRHGYGRCDSGYLVLLHLDLDEDLPEAKRRDIAESVIASYESP